MFTATIWMQRDAEGFLGVELLIVRETRISSLFCEMGIILNSKGSLYAMKVLIIKLVVWLGWLSCVAVGQLEVSEAVTGFVNFPEVGISCIGNLAVFITSISKGRLDLEMGARDVFATLRGPKLHHITNSTNNNLVGLTTCKIESESENENENYKKASVVMLSCNLPDCTMKQFMRYNSNAHDVQSIFLSFKSLADPDPKKTCKHDENHKICKCIVFENVKEITDLLARRIPRTLKLLRESQCLLPCAGCLNNGCHGCNEGMLDVERSGSGDPEQPDALTERKPEEGFIPPPVCEILEYYDHTQKDRSCICIPVSRPEKDEWTKLLTTSFRTKDNEDRRVSVMASDAMENYTAQEPKGTRMDFIKGRKNLREGIKVEFGSPSLLLPRLTEILINLLLVVWFRVDGFSTSMVARKAIKIYVVGSKESGFAANAFLRTALVKSYNKNTKSDGIDSYTENDTHIFQVLTFRGRLLGLTTLSFIAGAVNLLCSIFWAVFIASEGNKGKWYDIHPMPPSISIVAVIIVAIGIALGMDCLHIYLYWRDRKDIKKQGREENTSEKPRKVPPIMPVCAVIVVEIICILSGSVALGVWGKKPFKTWVYSVVQALVWLKWGIGSYLLGELHSESNSEYNWKSGILVYSSSFFLNFMLAAVRSSWKYSPQV